MTEKSSPSRNDALHEYLRRAPDCGDNSCMFGGRGKGGMRTNGGCRCFKDLPTEKRIYVERLYEAFVQSETQPMSAVVKGDAMDARVYFDDPYKTMAPPTDKYGEALAHAESARHGIYPMATDWKGHRQIIDILAEALTKMAAQLIETQGHLIRRNAELAETLCAPSAEPQMDDWDVAITEMCHQLGMNADYDKGFAEGWCAAMKEAESKYVNREPDGWAVTQPDGTSSPRGFWFVGCYLDKKMAEQIVRKVAQGAEAKPIYFAPSSTCEGGEGGEGS